MVNGKPNKTTRPLDDDSAITSYMVAAILRCNPSTVIKWSKGGDLPMYRTLGGHRRFRLGDVREFARKHNMPLAPG